MNSSLRSLTLAASTILAVATVASTAHAASYWTPWVSEENGGPAAACQSDYEAATGVGCQGSYCDSVRLYCRTMPDNVYLDTTSTYWSGYFSEETSGVSSYRTAGWYRHGGDNYHVCNASGQSGILSGIKCRGGYCDDISVRCSQPFVFVNRAKYYVHMKDCAWSAWYSEETGSIDFGNNRHVTGVRCSGSRCDNKQYYVCSLDLDNLTLVPRDIKVLN